MKYAILLFTLFGTQRNSFAEIPHMHNPRHAGLVVMLGDDHYEAVREKKDTLVFYPSDKFRKALDPKLTKLEFQWISGKNKNPLTFTSDSKAPFKISIHVPEQNGDLQIRAPRLDKPKGYLSLDTWQTVDIKKVPNRTHE